MNDKAKELFAAFHAGRMSRRELMARRGQARRSAPRPQFHAQRGGDPRPRRRLRLEEIQGHEAHLLLNKHPYADAMIADLDNFKKMTGMDVTYDIFPEDVYFDKVTAALSSKSSQYDAFMTGAYMTWTYGPAGWIDDLNAFIKDPNKTNPRLRTGRTCCRACAPRPPGTACPAARSARPTPSNGAFPGASSSTRSPITARCTTRPACSRRTTCRT